MIKVENNRLFTKADTGEKFYMTDHELWTIEMEREIEKVIESIEETYPKYRGPTHEMQRAIQHLELAKLSMTAARLGDNNEKNPEAIIS